MKIGLVGYGGVGKAFEELIKERQLDIELDFILNSKGGYLLNSKGEKEWKEGLTFSEAIERKIDCLVELTPTNKEDGQPALNYIKTALERGISVVTGNKGPILHGYKELREVAARKKVYLGIGCTVGGALPSICGGEASIKGSSILSIEGILNGTTNFILKEMEESKVEYEVALKKVIDLGIAEGNPSMDVEGYDSAIKMVILTNYFFDEDIKLSDVKIQGITKVKLGELRKDEKLKLLGKAYKINNKVSIVVEPTFLNKEHNLYNVEGKNKGVSFKTDILGDITIFGGASSPKNAAASILRDIIIYREKV